MLPILYTRRYLLEQQRQHRPATSRSMIYSARDHLYAVNRLDSLELPGKKGVLHFRTTMHHSGRPQQIFLGLLETSTMHTAARSPGFGVSIDLDTGLVMDLVNDQGVLGYLESAPIPAHTGIEIRVEMDVFGRVCLPRIFVGEESILHPALYLDARENVSALTGTTLTPLGDAEFSGCELEFEEATGLTASVV